jgi:hypothetical protein
MSGDLLTKGMSRDRGSLMRLLQEKELTKLQPERQQVAVAVGERQLLEEAEATACQVAEVLVQLLMLRTMGVQKAKPFSLNLKMT